MSAIELAGGLLFGFGGWLVALGVWVMYRNVDDRCEKYFNLYFESAKKALYWARRAETAEQITAAMHAAEERAE